MATDGQKSLERLCGFRARRPGVPVPAAGRGPQPVVLSTPSQSGTLHHYHLPGA